MLKSMASVVGVSAVLAAVFGSCPAGANPYDPYSGQTYADAKSSISGGGGTVVVATKEGSYLPLDQCIVTGSRSSNGKVMLDLNCNDVSALNGHPGSSVTSPSGKKVQQIRETAQQISDNFTQASEAGAASWCEENQSSCAQFCTGDGAGLCSSEVMAFLGA